MSYGVAFEYANGQLRWLTDPYGTKVSVSIPEPSESALLTVMQQNHFQPGLSRVTLVRLDCPEENLTDQERAWHEISTLMLRDRLGVPVQAISDIKALVLGIGAPEADTELPSGILILNDSDTDPGTGGVIRKYLAHDQAHWQSLPFGEGGSLLDFVSNGVLLLSHDMPGVREAIRLFLVQHPDIERLVVWSPDDLPIQRGAYNELRPDKSVACRVTILTDPSFALSSILRQG